MKKAAAKKASTKASPANKAVAKKSAAKKSAAKKSAAKKSAAKKPAASATGRSRAALPEALKHALGIGANEVLVEGLPSIIEDAEGFLEGGDLGLTYQSFVGPDTFRAAEVDAMLSDLAAWDPRGPLAAWQRLGTAMFAAGMDFARALVCLATGAGEVPPAVAPHAASIGHVVEALRQAIADGDYDDRQLNRLVG